ncbi:hypothetical protein DTO271G3_2959 [Paecilomyces variotii]|nr:hypothetical protein DTO271G3_2959 [Paecilomyces variotii]
MAGSRTGRKRIWAAVDDSGLGFPSAPSVAGMGARPLLTAPTAAVRRQRRITLAKTPFAVPQRQAEEVGGERGQRLSE